MLKNDSLVLTPTARLTRAMSQRLARTQADAGWNAWIQPAVLNFPSWLTVLRDDYFLMADDERVPINSSQSLVLWQSLIDADIFIGEPKVAELAQAAWRMIHEYGLDQPEQWPGLWLSEDSRQFRDWAGRYVALCAEQKLVDEWCFNAELPDLIEAGLVELPDQLNLLGFDLAMPPLQQRIIEAADKAGCRIEWQSLERRQLYIKTDTKTNTATITRFIEGDEELLAAARWARQRIEAEPDQSIGIVVPDLQGRLGRIESLFRQVFDPPSFGLSPSGPDPWHISLGHALADWPLVADASLFLGLDPWRISQPQATRLLRSPFVDGWIQEQSGRAEVMASLAQFAPHWIDAREIARQSERQGAERLGGRLAAWQAFRRNNAKAALPSVWAQRFQEELSALGFGHGRGLDSREYQVLQRWHELLEAFSELDVVIDRPLSRGKALRHLSERARAAVFRERNPGAAIEVLGVEEALGSEFDALWITTLDGETWPGPARRDPLIPGPVQARVPGSSAQGCLDKARAQLNGLMSAAGQVHGSFASGSSEQPLEITPLLRHLSMVEGDGPVSIQTMEVDILPDDSQAPALPVGPVRGGTGVLQSQSDCPFKAFAGKRLGARDLSPPRPGLDASARGSLLHQALEHFWRKLPDQASLNALGDEELARRIESSVNAALDWFIQRNRLALSEAGRKLEAECLHRTMQRWLAVERDRDAFRVDRLEAPITLKFGKLELSGKVDRVDELEGGGSVLIDYKTGQSGRNSWAPDARLADVQLPAYAVSMNPAPAAISFARLRPESLVFDGLAEVDAGMSGVEVIGQIRRAPFKETESWQALLADWKISLEALAEDFQQGRAAVDPRKPEVCRYCHLMSLCRIHERQTLMDDKLTETTDE